MKKVPSFVKNSSDNMHCVNAVFRMVHQYFFGSDFSWGEIDLLTKSVQGKATWTFVGEMEFAKKGLDVLNIEPIDYVKLYKEGEHYLTKIFGKETAEYYLKKSNIASVLSYIPQYLSVVKHETRRASMNEIIKYLKGDALIGAEVNSCILNKKQEFNLHFVLLYDFDRTHITFHDPGLPPMKARKITLKEFDECFNFKGGNGQITVFSHKNFI